MLKRVKYVSQFSGPLGPADVEAIGRESARNNEALGITGVLMTSGGLFFQILEGPAEAVDLVYARIAGDPRHKNLVLLGQDTGVRDRVFPGWAMKVLALDEARSTRLEPLRAILETVYQQRAQIDGLVGVLERGVWNELAHGSAR